GIDRVEPGHASAAREAEPAPGARCNPDRGDRATVARRVARYRLADDGGDIERPPDRRDRANRRLVPVRDGPGLRRKPHLRRDRVQPDALPPAADDAPAAVSPGMAASAARDRLGRSARREMTVDRWFRGRGSWST